MLAVSATPRRFPKWLLGYLDVTDEAQSLQYFRGKRGAAALVAMDELVAKLDYGIGTFVPGETAKA